MIKRSVVITNADYACNWVNRFKVALKRKIDAHPAHLYTKTKSILFTTRFLSPLKRFHIMLALDAHAHTLTKREAENETLAPEHLCDAACSTHVSSVVA
jgi:hypothetical protein